MNENTFWLGLIIWVSLLFVLCYGEPDLLDHLTGKPVEVQCDD